MTICLLKNTIETPTRVRVGVIHYKPEKLPPEVRESGIMLPLMTEGTMPRPTQEVGKAGVLYINPVTKKLWYEYVDRPLSQEELLAKVVERLDTLIVLLTPTPELEPKA